MLDYVTEREFFVYHLLEFLLSDAGEKIFFLNYAKKYFHATCSHFASCVSCKEKLFMQLCTIMRLTLEEIGNTHYYWAP